MVKRRIDAVVDIGVQGSDKVDAVADDLDRIDGRDVDVDVEVDDTEIDNADSKLRGLADAAAGLPGPVGEFASKLGAVAGPGGAALAIGGALVAAANSAADVAVEAETLKNLIGGSVEDASRLAAVWKSTGDNELNDLQDIVLNMNAVLAESPELAAQIGINLADGRDGGQRFIQVVEHLNTEIDDTGERGQAAAQLFGEEGVRQVNTLTTLVGTDLQAAMDGVEDGQVIDDEDVANALELKEQFREMQAAITGMAVAFGSEIVPYVDYVITAIRAVEGLEISGPGDGGSIGLFTSLADLAGVVKDAWAPVFGDGGSIETGAEHVEEVTAAVEDSIDATGGFRSELASSVLDMDNVRRAGERSMGAIEDGADDAAAAVDDVTDAVSGLDRTLSRLDDEEAAIRLGQSFDAAKAKIQETDVSIEDSRLTLIDLQQEVGNYIIELGGIPDEKATQILALIDQGKLDQARALLAELTKPKSVSIYADVRLPAGWRLGANGKPIPPGGSGPTIPDYNSGGPTSSATSITVNMARTADGADVVAALDRWTRTNGAR